MGNLYQHCFEVLNFHHVCRYLLCVRRLVVKNHKMALIALLLFNIMYRNNNSNLHDDDDDAFESLVNEYSN